MWARSFVRLMRDVVAVLDGRSAAGQPATFHDGLAVQVSWTPCATGVARG